MFHKHDEIADSNTEIVIIIMCIGVVIALILSLINWN